MFSKGSTWPPATTTRPRVFSGTMTPAISDRQESGRPATESAGGRGDSRPMESDWDAIIDRATD